MLMKLTVIGLCAIKVSGYLRFNLRLGKVPVKTNPSLAPTENEYGAYNNSTSSILPTILPVEEIVEDPITNASMASSTEAPSVVPSSVSAEFTKNATAPPSPGPKVTLPVLPVKPPPVGYLPQTQTEAVVVFRGSDSKPQDHFGHALATDGTKIFIGTYIWGKKNTVYVENLDKSASPPEWFESAKIALPGSLPPTEFSTGLAAVNGSLLVGSPYDSTVTRNAGSVTIYKNGITGYKTDQVISCKSKQAQFGLSVAVNGDLLAISAPGDKSAADRGLSGYLGRVHIYTYDYSQEQYIQVATISPTLDESNRIGSGFGSAISLSNTVLGVSAVPDKVKSNVAGAVFLYEIIHGRGGLDDPWDDDSDPLSFIEFPLDPPELATDFGRALLVSDKHAFASASDPTSPGFGCVYVFSRSSVWVTVDDELKVQDVSWNFVAKLKAPVAAVDYGYSLASYKDSILAVGAPALFDSGSVYLYKLRTITDKSQDWNLISTVTCPENQKSSDFGVSLATFRDSLLVGADTANSNTNRSGAVYLFKGLFSNFDGDSSAGDTPDDSSTQDAESNNVFRAARQNLTFILGFMLPTVIIGSVLIGRHIAKYARAPKAAASNDPKNSTYRGRKRAKKQTKLGLISAALSPSPPFSETLNSSPTPTVLLDAVVAPRPFSHADEEEELEAKVDHDRVSSAASDTADKGSPTQGQSVWNLYGISRSYSHQQLPTEEHGGEERGRESEGPLQIDTPSVGARHPVLQSPIPVRPPKRRMKWPSLASAWRAVTQQSSQQEPETIRLQEQGIESIRV